MELIANTGWTDEARAASLAVRQEKARLRKKRDEAMFQKQKDRGGRRFIENWYPRGDDGRYDDPHYGVTTREAPYGYVDYTRKPRKEPLYDRVGNPIIPRPREELDGPATVTVWPFAAGGRKVRLWPFGKDYSSELGAVWLWQREKALRTWGKFGRKRRFMDANPGATEEDWKKEEVAQFAKWKTEKRAEWEQAKKEGRVKFVKGAYLWGEDEWQVTPPEAARKRGAGGGDADE